MVPHSGSLDNGFVQFEFHEGSMVYVSTVIQRYLTLNAARMQFQINRRILSSMTPAIKTAMMKAMVDKPVSRAGDIPWKDCSVLI